MKENPSKIPGIEGILEWLASQTNVMLLIIIMGSIYAGVFYGTWAHLSFSACFLAKVLHDTTIKRAKEVASADKNSKTPREHRIAELSKKHTEKKEDLESSQLMKDQKDMAYATSCVRIAALLLAIIASCLSLPQLQSLIKNPLLINGGIGLSILFVIGILSFSVYKLLIKPEHNIDKADDYNQLLQSYKLAIANISALRLTKPNPNPFSEKVTYREGPLQSIRLFASICAIVAAGFGMFHILSGVPFLSALFPIFVAVPLGYAWLGKKSYVIDLYEQRKLGLALMIEHQQSIQGKGKDKNFSPNVQLTLGSLIQILWEMLKASVPAVFTVELVMHAFFKINFIESLITLHFTAAVSGGLVVAFMIAFGTAYATAIGSKEGTLSEKHALKTIIWKARSSTDNIWYNHEAEDQKKETNPNGHLASSMTYFLKVTSALTALLTISVVVGMNFLGLPWIIAAFIIAGYALWGTILYYNDAKKSAASTTIIGAACLAVLLKFSIPHPFLFIVFAISLVVSGLATLAALELKPELPSHAAAQSAAAASAAPDAAVNESFFQTAFKKAGRGMATWFALSKREIIGHEEDVNGQASWKLHTEVDLSYNKTIKESVKSGERETTLANTQNKPQWVENNIKTFLQWVRNYLELLIVIPIHSISEIISTQQKNFLQKLFINPCLYLASFMLKLVWLVFMLGLHPITTYNKMQEMAEHKNRPWLSWPAKPIAKKLGEKSERWGRKYIIQPILHIFFIASFTAWFVLCLITFQGGKFEDLIGESGKATEPTPATESSSLQEEKIEENPITLSITKQTLDLALNNQVNGPTIRISVSSADLINKDSWLQALYKKSNLELFAHLQTSYNPGCKKAVDNSFVTIETTMIQLLDPHAALFANQETNIQHQFTEIAANSEILLRKLNTIPLLLIYPLLTPQQKLAIDAELSTRDLDATIASCPSPIHGKTAVHLAAENGMTLTLNKMLESAEAKKIFSSSKDFFGQTPFDLLLERSDCAAILNAISDKPNLAPLSRNQVLRACKKLVEGNAKQDVKGKIMGCNFFTKCTHRIRQSSSRYLPYPAVGYTNVPPRSASGFTGAPELQHQDGARPTGHRGLSNRPPTR
jgi:hypothetical protein